MLTVSYSGQFGNLNLAGDLWLNNISHALTEDLFTERNQLVRSYHTNGEHRMFLTQLSASWKFMNELRFKLTGTWKSVAYKNAQETLRCFAGNAQIDYYWRELSFGTFLKSKDKELNLNRMYIDSPASYGVFCSWSHGNLQMEAGVSNPFSRHRRMKERMNRDVYSYRKIVTGNTFRFTGYVKFAYYLDFGKKTKREAIDIDYTIKSAIMKAE